MNTGENHDASTRSPLLQTAADAGLWTGLRDKPRDKKLPERDRSIARSDYLTARDGAP